MKTNPPTKIIAIALVAALAVPLAASARPRHPDPEDVLAGAFIASVVAPLVIGAAVASNVRIEAAPAGRCAPPPPQYYAYPPPPPPPAYYYGYPPPPPPPQYYYGNRPMRPHRRPPHRPRYY